MGRLFRVGTVGAIVALVAAIACAQASAAYWAGEYRVLVHKADQKGSGTYHQDSSGACTATVDGGGSEDVHIVGGSATMMATGVDAGMPGSSSGLQLGGVPVLSAGGTVTRNGQLTSTPDPHPCAGGGGDGGGGTAPAPDCGTKPVTQRFSLISQSDGTLRWGSAIDVLGLPIKDPFARCPSFVEHPFPAVLPVTIRYNPADFGPGLAPTLRGHEVNPFYVGQPQGSESADVELRLVPLFVTPAVVLGSRSTQERIDGHGNMRAPMACPRAGACKGTLSVAYGSGAEPVAPAVPVAATAARTAKVRYPAPLKTGPLVSSLTLGSARFSLRKGQHQRIKLRLTKHSRADLKLLKGARLGLIVSQKRGKAKLAYTVGTARTR
ncbi:MAG: hypothetical protein QOK21_823 [Solirubrobacteraceae bacterium]|nr:hypothetical protein [Solirubrobacteraceae bacterium]